MNGSSSNEATAASIISLSPAGQQYLSQARPWVKFISILAWIVFGFMIFFGFILAIGGIVLPFERADENSFGALSRIEFVVLGFLYILPAFLYIPPAVFLWRYASAILSLKENRSSEALENALKHQTSFGATLVYCWLLVWHWEYSVLF